MSSGSAAFASPPPSAAPGITPPPSHQAPHPGTPGGPVPPPPAGPQGSPPGPQGYGSASYGAPAPQHPGQYGGAPAHPAPYGTPPQGQAYGAPQSPYGTPPPPHGPASQAPAGPPNPVGQPGGYGQPGQYGQPPQAPPPAGPPHPGAPQYPQGGQPAPIMAGAPNAPGQLPQAPYATRTEPGRDMPMAGASPIRRNMDDTAELPAFLDSARSDEGPGTATKTAEAKPLKRKFPLTTGFTALLRHRYALSVLVRRDLAVKYQSTVMGYVWSLIEPLGLTLIYWFVFDMVFGGGRSMPKDANGESAGYLLFIVSGIFAYQWFSAAVNEGAKSLNGQSSLITVMKVPREVFPVSKTFARFAEYVVGFPILLIVALWQGGTFGLNLLWLIPAILVQTMLLAGMTFILAATNVLYKDVSRFLPLVMRVLFYASAIIYPVTKVSDALGDKHPVLYDIYSSNPLIGIFSMHRAAFIPALAPTNFQLGMAVGISAFLMFFGRWIFYRLEPRFLKAL